VSQPAFTLDQLLVLEAIDSAGSFADAARALHRVPSAVSYTVKALEDAVGVPLFDRSGHRAALNANGQRVLEEARAVLWPARCARGGSRRWRSWWTASIPPRP
jgi:DNA-binding transcriptional LysR family regulator